MNPAVKHKLEQIFRYPFFSSVGRSLPNSVTTVDTWTKAIKQCNMPKWESSRLRARNALQIAVNKASWDRTQEWNPLAKELSPAIDDYVDSMLLKSSLNEVERKSVKAKISWDLMFICFEEEYRDLVVPLFYIPYLDVWYNAGHFPCGIVGKKLPDDWDGRITDGQLIVF